MSREKKKEKESPLQIKQLNKSCRICENPPLQIQILLSSLKSRLALKIKESTEEYGETNERNRAKPTKLFMSLLTIVLGEKNMEQLGSKICQHDKVFRLFKKKLKSPEKIFKEALQNLAIEIGSRGYHFQLLNQIVPEVVTKAEKFLCSEKRSYRKDQKSTKLKSKKNSFFHKKWSNDVHKIKAQLKEPIIKIENGVEREEIELQKNQPEKEKVVSYQNNWQIPYMWNVPYIYPFYPQNQ